MWCMRHELPPKPQPPRQSCCRSHGSGCCMRHGSYVIAAAAVAAAATARTGAAAATATAAAAACATAAALSAAAAIARAPRQLLPRPWQLPLHAVDLTPEQTSDGAALWRLASRHACCARSISPSAACTTSRRLHKDSTASLPQSQPPLHLARGYIRYAMGYFRLRKQLWDCSQLHLPCRRDHPSVRCREGWRELHDGAAEQQSSSNRCDVRRCTVRNSSARPIYPGNS